MCSFGEEAFPNSVENYRPPARSVLSDAPNISGKRSCSGQTDMDLMVFESIGSIFSMPDPLLLNRATQLTPFDHLAINV